MPRTLDRSKVLAVVEAAARVFARLGLRRTQIADVAAEGGVSVGTVYRYVDSKEALFDLAVRAAFGADQAPLATCDLPASARPEQTLAFVRAALGAVGHPELTSRLDAAEPAPELVVGAVYDTIAERQLGIRILDKSAREWPELAKLFFVEVRRPLLALLASWLRRHASALDVEPDADATARFVLEACSWLAMHRHYDADPAGISDDLARATAVRRLTASLTGISS